MASPDPQDVAHAHSISDPTSFWDSHARKLCWDTPYTTPLVCSPSPSPSPSPSAWTWFPGGRISTTFNLVTRHVLSGNGDATAIIWDSPVTGSKRKISYRELQEEVEVFAAVLRERGVGKGDRVLIYMPMIPEAAFAMLAAAHLGAIHCVVFGGFAPAECAKRIESAEPKIILTASCGIEGGTGGKRRVIPYLPLVREAVEKSSWKPEGTILFQRDELFQSLDKSMRELNWNRLVRSVKIRRGASGPSGAAVPGGGLKREKVPGGNGGYVEIGEAFPSEDPQYIIYTSGTTGKPKGVVRSIGGNLVGLQYAIEHLFNIRSRADTIFCASDLGWVVGHAYILYSPLLVGAATVLFEGKPIGTPDASTFWRIIADYKVNVLFTAPTALRAIHRSDPHLSGLTAHNTSSLRALFLAGERSEASIIALFQQKLFGTDSPGSVIDNWWSSESGSPITGIGLGYPHTHGHHHHPHIKPGSAGRPLPGWDVRIIDDTGATVPAGHMGNIVLGLPLAPSACTRLWGDPDGTAFAAAYRARFPGLAVADTGDAGFVDAAGFLHVMSRTDDVINVAAHRFSTGAIEEAVLRHPGVVEAYVVACPDGVKGHVPFGVVVVESVWEGARRVELEKEVNAVVRREIGPIAVLKGVVVVGRVPRTRSGKTMRRLMREMVENAYWGRGGKVEVPATVEDAESVAVVEERVEAWFTEGRSKL